MKKRRIECILFAMLILLAGCSSKTETSPSPVQTSESTIATTLRESTKEVATSETSASSEQTEETTAQTEESTTQTEDPTSITDGSDKNVKALIDATGEERPYLKNPLTDKIIEVDDFTSTTEGYFVVNQFQYSDGMWSEAFDIGREYPKCEQGDYLLNVTKNLELPTEVDGFTIRWESSDESLVRPDGTVTCPHAQSKYVLLTAVITKDGRSLVSRSIVRVARDLYADVTTDKVLDPSFANDPGIFASMGIDESFFNHWFYELDELEQLYFYEDYVDNLFLNQETRGKTRHVMVSGTLSEVHTSSINEAWLNVYSVRKPLGLPEWCELRFDTLRSGLDEVIYDFQQYYQDVPVDGKVRLLVSDKMQTINSWMIQIPDNFDAKPKVSSDEVTAQFGLDKERIELSIKEIDDQVKLVWQGYVSGKSEYVLIDAHTGKELSRSSTIVS